VLFTDESRFCIYGNDRRHRIWRRNTQYHQQNIVRIRAFYGGSVMVWAGISFFHHNELVVIPPPGLNSRRYVEEVLRPHVLPMSDRIGRRFLLMQDNARPHTAQNTRHFLRSNNISTLDHPPMSPDLNPIEHL
jgi:hypothetical protein